MTMQAVVGTVLALVAAYGCYDCFRRKFEKQRIRELFSQFIYLKTMDAMAVESFRTELNEDGLWVKEHEDELRSRHGDQWVAVIGKKVVAAAATGDEAWDEATARDPSRKPFVRRLSGASAARDNAGTG